MTLADIPGWRSRSPEGLVELALERRMVFKFVGIELGSRAPDAGAARRLVSEYADGDAEPWMTAHLLGCIGHELGYATVVAILESAPGSLAESYAGPAMAKIRGVAAFDDLVRVMNASPKRRSREGAAYGLLRLQHPPAAAAVLEAASSGQIRYSMGAALVDQPLDDADVTPLISGNERERRVAIAYIDRLISSSTHEGRRGTQLEGRLESCRDRWLEPVRQLLADPDFRMAPRQRAALSRWASSEAVG